MFDNYLSQLDPSIPGMGDIEASLQRNQRMAPPPEQRGPHGLGHILGLIGATLASARGRPAPYFEQLMALKQQKEQQGQNAAFANYLGSLDPELGGLIQAAGPAAAMQAYGIKHPKDREPTGLARDYDWYSHLPPEEQKRADAFIEKRKFNPFASPITMGQGDSIEYPDGQGGEVTATNPQTGERVRLNPESGQWEPMGGPTPSASGPFPGQ